MLDFGFTNQFKKDLKLMEKRHYDMDAIYEIIGMIMFQEPLPERCREHGLSGTLEGLTDCHVKNDWVMIYHTTEEKVIFHSTGTHSDLL